MKKNPTIEQEWESFRQKVIPVGASKIQVQEMRRAFYSGAVSFFSLVNRLGDEEFTEEEGAAELSKLEKELEQFFSRIGKEF